MLVGDDDASGGTVTFMVWNVGLGATGVDCAADCPASEPHPATAVASSEIATKTMALATSVPGNFNARSSLVFYAKSRR